MSPDAPVCLCFGVSRRKVEAFVRVHQPRRASELSQCGGAGTGCGWCVPYLTRLFDDGTAAELPGGDDYEASRTRYRDTGRRPKTPDGG